MIAKAKSNTPPQIPRFMPLSAVACELAVSLSQVYALVRSGDLVGIQIGGRNQWRVERVKLEEYIQSAYQRTAAALTHLPDDPPELD